MNTSTSPAFQSTIGSQIVQDSKYHLNLAQDVIVTTEDRFRLCLIAHRSHLEAKSAWIGPLSLLVTIALVLLTSNFKDTLGLSAATWNAIFVIACVASAVWTVIAGLAALRSDPSLDKLVGEIKKHAGSASPGNPAGASGAAENL